MKAPHTTSSAPVHLVAQQRAHATAPTVGSNALRVDDQAGHLTYTLAAFRALEKLTTPAGVDDCEHLEPTRTEMGALMRVLNDELARQLDALNGAVSELRNAVKVAP